MAAAISAFALALPWVVVGVPSPAQAGPGDGTVTVNVLRDFFHDGSVHPEDVGQAGIPVTITDDAGAQITVPTNASGVAAFTPATSALQGGRYRVSAVIPPALAYLQPAPAGGPAPSFSSHVEFVNVSGGANATVTMGVTDPGDYSQTNPDLVTPAHTFSGTTRATTSTRAVVRWPYARRGVTPTPTTIATYAQVGTVYGLATRARDGLVFAGAFAKRHTDYGPLGWGGIYVLNGTGGAANFANLTNAGSTAHGADPDHDSPFFDVPGKQGLGDLELSADGNTLYAVNLATKSLVTFNVTNTTATPSGLATPTGTVAIPDPGCVGGAWRLFGLGRNDGKIYVGGVCDAETSNQRANLRAYVLAYDPAAGTMTPVFNHTLNFKRGPNYDNPGQNRSGAFFWHPWSGVFNSANWHSSVGTNNWNHAEPELSDIEFDRDGSLMLGFRDRFADQLGSGGLGVNANDNTRYFGHGTAGALERACRNANGTWSWQGENGCPNNNTKARPNKKSKDPAVIEYYAGSWTQLNDSTHEEVAQGGLAFAPRFGEVTSTTLDPTRTANTGGVGFFDNKTGDYDSADGKGYLINPQGTFGNLNNNPTGRFGKANGLGDLELIAAAAPVQIGNRVWHDVDSDGTQDPSEAPLSGATVQLLRGTTVVATKVTGPTGQYYFGTADRLEPNTAYTLKFDYTTATIPGSPPIAAVRWTTKDAGGNDAVDSDVDPATGVAPVATGPPGYVNHTLDAGIVVAVNRLGNFVWVDTDRDGIQDGSEPGVPGVPVTVKNAAGDAVGIDTTDANGKYLVEVAQDGAYTVCFDLTTLPDPVSDYRPTTQNGGTNDAVDSDASPADGCTGPVTVGSGARENITVDMGLIPPLNSLGDYVWIDADRDGVQDPTETPVEGVPVMVRDSGGTSVDTAFTDATGKYTFTDLPDGSYDVCFNLSALPPVVADYTATTKDAGANDALDSDADQVTGCTPQVPQGLGARANTTLDLGLVSPLNSLGDYVWIDADKDGVQDTVELPVQGVVATAKSGTTVVGTDTTDATGKYLIEDLPDGTYTVCFDIANLPPDVDDYTVTTKDASGNDAVDSDGDPTTGCTGPVTLGLGARQNLTLDLGLIAPPNSLGDFAWADADKDGVQDTGELPVQGVVATAMSGTTVVGTDTTDATGKYLIEDLPDGTYTVCFDISSVPAPYSDYVPTLPNVGADDAVDSDGDPATVCTEPVELGTNKRQNLTLDLGLVPPVNRVGDFVWIDADEDGIQDTGEKPVDGVPVRLMNQAGEQVGTDTTEDGGKYLFDDIPNGTYTVCFDLANMPAAVDDYAPTTSNAGGDDEADSDAGPTGCTGSVTMGEGNRVNFTLDLGLVAPPNSLGDYVWIDADKDGVQDPTETPVAGVVANAMVGTTVVGTDTTDSTGKYLLDDLPDGTYQVCFDLVNMPAAVDDYTVTTPNAGGDDGADSDADPASGCTPPVQLGVDKRQNLTLDLGLVAPVNKLGDYVWVDTDKDGAQDEGEEPVEGVKVTVRDGQDTVVGTDTTDGNGKYLFEDLPDGRYTVCFDVANLPDAVGDYTVTTPNAGADDTVDSDAAAGAGCAEPVELGVNKRQNLTVDAGLVAPPNQLGDRVWSDEDKDGVQDPGEPGVPDVPVTVRSGDTVVATDTTDADGNYLVENLPDGTYTVCFDLSDLPAPYTGYIVTAPNAGADAADSDASPATACTEPVELGVDKRKNLTVDAGIRPEANRITGGTWYDRDRDGVRDGGEPLMPSVPVALRDEDGKVIGTGKTGQDGTVTFYDVPSGKYRLCYGAKNLPKPYGDTKLTTSNVGNESYDSDAVSPSGCTELVYVGPSGRGKRVDAGYVRPASGLPVTGASLIGLVGVGIVLLSTGFMLILAVVRRRRETA